MTKRLKIIDCFCGAGGLALGFMWAGFEPILSFDSDAISIKTYNHNIGAHGHVLDVKKVNKILIKQITKQNLNDISVIVGGPPCQGFSVQRRGSNLDPRNQLVLEFIRLVEEIRPRFFLMENVGGLLSLRGKAYLDEIKSRVAQANYVLHIKKLNAADFDVPQLRHRVFLIGERIDGVFVRYEFPKPKSGKYRTVRQSIKDLITKTEQDVPNHKADKLSDLNIKRIRSLKEGQGRDSLPRKLQLRCHTENIGHRHLDVYGRMAWDQPSSTITARFDSFSRGRFGHPELDRSITLREGARLQTFPDDFVFFGTKVQIARQIGNAVPPLLALAIGESIRQVIQED